MAIYCGAADSFHPLDRRSPVILHWQVHSPRFRSCHTRTGDGVGCVKHRMFQTSRRSNPAVTETGHRLPAPVQGWPRLSTRLRSVACRVFRGRLAVSSLVANYILVCAPYSLALPTLVPCSTIDNKTIRRTIRKSEDTGRPTDRLPVFEWYDPENGTKACVYKTSSLIPSFLILPPPTFFLVTPPLSAQNARYQRCLH